MNWMSEQQQEEEDELTDGLSSLEPYKTNPDMGFECGLLWPGSRVGLVTNRPSAL
jgi:hypothetical protein